MELSDELVTSEQNRPKHSRILSDVRVKGSLQEKEKEIIWEDGKVPRNF